MCNVQWVKQKVVFHNLSRVCVDNVSEGAQALHSVDDIPPGPCLKTTSW